MAIPTSKVVGSCAYYADSAVEFRDLEFARIPMRRYGSCGTPFTSYMAIGMPRIPPKHLNTVCYLYESVESARIGKEFGGTAFLVAVPSRFKHRTFCYAVTNWHVAPQGSSVLRVNRRDGTPEIFEFGPEEWEFDPNYDIAVKAVPLNPDVHDVAFVHVNGFVTREKLESEKIGPGDDVFMVGRFVDHDGGAINRPAVRFGNVSVMPSPIKQGNGRMADSYCIDLHSRPGYSGSPVFVYRTPGYDLEETLGQSVEESYALLAGTNYLGLLGIHFGQFPEIWELKDRGYPAKEGSVPLIREGAYVKGLSGMACVLPAWTILNVLNMPKLRQQREEADKREAERRQREGTPMEPEPEGSP
jgi:hypothetical protein